MENCEDDEQVLHRELDEQHSETLQLQHEYDSVVQKIESDDRFHHIQEEASLLMHSWPDEWFLRSKKVPKTALEPETEEVLIASILFVLFALQLTRKLSRFIILQSQSLRILGFTCTVAQRDISRALCGIAFDSAIDATRRQLRKHTGKIRLPYIRFGVSLEM